MNKKKNSVLSLSGGLDSSTLLLHLLANNYDVQCISIDYNQKHKIELERAKSLVEYVNRKYDKVIEDGDKPNFYPIKHQIIKIDGLSQLLNSTLVEGGAEVPEGHYEQDNMLQTVVENRNKIFSSIIQSVALATANKNNSECIIAMGIHAGDHRIYKDCRQEFRDADYKAFLEGNENGELVSYYTPYLDVTKFEILQDGLKCCEQLGLDFDEVYKRTNTSYKPILIYNGVKRETTSTTDNIDVDWKWYSDYKSAASVERIEAFIKLGRPDPVAYADENGPTTWETAKAHVEQVLKEHSENTK